MDATRQEAVQEAGQEATPVVVDVDADAEKRGGVKESVQNADAIAAAKEQAEKEKVAGTAAPVKVDKPAAKPSFFIKKTARHVVKLDVLSEKTDGRVVSVSKAGLGIDFEADFPFLIHSELTFEFSVPNYEDMSTYRQRSSVWRREAQQVIVDKLQLRNFLLVWHLKDWNLPDDNGKKVELTLDSNGSLSEESLAMVYAMPSTLLDVVMTVYEKDILLT
jgi:hypothetical protein